MTVPPHDTFSHLLLAVDLQELENCFLRRIRNIIEDFVKLLITSFCMNCHSTP
jgi:hypothetical protein